MGSLRSGGRRKLSRIHETMSLQIGLPSSDEVDAEAVHLWQRAYRENV